MSIIFHGGWEVIFVVDVVIIIIVSEIGELHKYIVKADKSIVSCAMTPECAKESAVDHILLLW